MELTEYQQRIVQYYRDTEHAYKDSWDLARSLAIHYGYWDEAVHSFPESLVRMNEIMMQAAAIQPADKVLDAGCGVGGSSIFLATVLGCRVTGITLSARQCEQATGHAAGKNVAPLVNFQVMDYCRTDFAPESFDVVWGCESICYADDKEKFVREAYRLLKPGGRLVVADGFVQAIEQNDHPVIRRWLDGWQVNYLESPERFSGYMAKAGFSDIHYRDISREVMRSARRLYRFYYLAKLYVTWRKISFSRPPTALQMKNIDACKFQYRGLQQRRWQYGLVVAKKP